MNYTNPLMNEMNFLQRMWYVKGALVPFIFVFGLIAAAVFVR